MGMFACDTYYYGCNVFNVVYVIRMLVCNLYCGCSSCRSGAKFAAGENVKTTEAYGSIST